MKLRPTEKLQTSTYAGLTAVVGAFLELFSNVKLANTFDVFDTMTWGQILPYVIVIAGGLWSMLHNEEKGV